jgi:hypothetical protein
LKLWLGLRDADMGILVEEVVVVVTGEMIVRLALVTTKVNLKARVYRTGSDVVGSKSGAGCQRSCLGEYCLLWLFVLSALQHFASLMKRSR